MKTLLILSLFFVYSCGDLTTEVQTSNDIEQVYYIAENKINFSNYKDLAIHKSRINFSNIFYIANKHTDTDSYTRFYLHKEKSTGGSLDFGYNCALNDSNVKRIKFSNDIEFETEFNDPEYLENYTFAGKKLNFIANASKQIYEIDKEVGIKPLLQFKLNKVINSLDDLSNFTASFTQKLEAKNTIIGLMFIEDSGKRVFLNIQFLHDAKKIYIRNEIVEGFKNNIQGDKGSLYFYLYYLEKTGENLNVIDKSDNLHSIPIVYKSVYTKKIFEVL